VSRGSPVAWWMPTQEGAAMGVTSWVAVAIACRRLCPWASGTVLNCLPTAGRKAPCHDAFSRERAGRTTPPEDGRAAAAPRAGTRARGRHCQGGATVSRLGWISRQRPPSSAHVDCSCEIGRPGLRGLEPG
jgi:hypothetical protein